MGNIAAGVHPPVSFVEIQNMALEVLADLVEWSQDIKGGHIRRTQRYLRILIEGLLDGGLYREQTACWGDMEPLIRASLFHDIGKLLIDERILQKTGKLTAAEFDMMKNHTTYGLFILARIETNTVPCEFLEHAKLFAGTHHEKWDGTGYPLELRGLDIPLEGRLMSIADVYDALTSVRPYKKALSHKEALRIIIQGTGAHFDPAIIELFQDIAGKFAPV